MGAGPLGCLGQCLSRSLLYYGKEAPPTTRPCESLSAQSGVSHVLYEIQHTICSSALPHGTRCTSIEVRPTPTRRERLEMTGMVASPPNQQHPIYPFSQITYRTLTRPVQHHRQAQVARVSARNIPFLSGPTYLDAGYCSGTIGCQYDKGEQGHPPSQPPPREPQNPQDRSVIYAPSAASAPDAAKPITANPYQRRAPTSP